MKKVNLAGLTLTKLEDFFSSLGHKKFRAVQLIKWIHQEGELDFARMTNLSKALREELADNCEIRLPQIVTCEESQDGTKKWLIKVDGGSCIEMVFIPERERGTLCISSQVGCSLDCSFCATGKQGFHRDLTSAEIIGQLWLAADSFNQFLKNNPRKISNVVMMGMGEPLMNFDNVVDSMSLMLEDNAYGLSKRRVTLSTSGVLPMLDKLGDVIDVSLAISLHAPYDDLRNSLVPINKKYPLKELIKACQDYPRTRNSKRITFEYVMLKGVNDKISDARQLIKLIQGIPAKINLIPFNPWPNSPYECSDRSQIKKFSDILNNAGYSSPIRKTRGQDIMAACGQLKSDSVKTKRSELKSR